MSKEWFEPTPRKGFTKRQREEVFKKMDGRCYLCNQRLNLRQWHIDHKHELADGGAHSEENWKAICIVCHIGKSGESKTRRASEGRKRRAYMGIKERKGPPMLGSKDSPFKRTFYNGVVRRDEL